MKNIKRIIFDADDTLWENNKFYINASESFFDLCEDAGYNRLEVNKAFDDLEIKVVREKGYGSENYVFILESIFKYYNNLNHKQLGREKFDLLLKDFNSHTYNKPPVFPGVQPTLKRLQEKYDLYVLTKGNIEEQKRKVKNSELCHYFQDIFVVPEKDDATYISIIEKYAWNINESCMVGNSPKSDINPALRIGMYAIFIPYPYTWKLDDEDLIEGNSKLFIVKNFSSIPDLFL